MFRLFKPWSVSVNDLSCLVVDMQQKFLDNHDADAVRKIVDGQIGVLDYCSKEGVPVFFLEYNRHGGTIDDLKVVAESCDVEYVRKDYNDGFYNSTLKWRLRMKGRDHLLLMGVNKSICVSETAQGALENGFRFSTSDDLLSDSNIKAEGGSDLYRNRKKSRWWIPRKAHFYTKSYQELLGKFSS